MWFEGSVPEAIQLAKDRNALFVVLVEGDQKPTDFLDQFKTLNSRKIVGIKIPEASPAFQQFTQICEYYLNLPLVQYRVPIFDCR
jgi:hypothetical protein